MKSAKLPLILFYKVKYPVDKNGLKGHSWVQSNACKRFILLFVNLCDFYAMTCANIFLEALFHDEIKTFYPMLKDFILLQVPCPHTIFVLLR